MDTKKITLDLLATGLTQQQLADLLACSQSSVNAFSKGKRGSRPTLELGLRLLALHKDRCTDLPGQDGAVLEGGGDTEPPN